MKHAFGDDIFSPYEYKYFIHQIILHYKSSFTIWQTFLRNKNNYNHRLLNYLSNYQFQFLLKILNFQFALVA